MAKAPKTTTEADTGDVALDTPAATVAPAMPVKAPDAEDTVLDAHLRRQANWEKDAQENPAFAGPDAAQIRREKIVAEVDAMTAANQREQAAIAAKRAAADEKATASVRAAELRAEAEQITDKASALMAEAERLEQLAGE